MRRPAAALTGSMIALSLLLAGCSSEGGGDATPTPSATSDAPAAQEPTAEDVAALEGVTVTGDPGSEPTLEFETPFDVTVPVARVETPGTGADLEEGQSLTIHYSIASGEDASSIGSTWTEDTPDRITLGDQGLIAALNDVLAGQKVGVRVLFASPSVPGTEATDDAPATEGRPANVMAIDVVEARSVPTRAEGEAVEPPAGLPEVTLADDGTPSIEVPADAEKPTELVAQPLIKGDGPVVKAGQTLTLHYKGWLWDGTEFDTSWNGTPFEAPIGTGNLIAGWDEGVVGQTVGSQVLLVVPPDKGYGDEGYNSIPGGSTLVFVVDILDAR